MMVDMTCGLCEPSHHSSIEAKESLGKAFHVLNPTLSTGVSLSPGSDRLLPYKADF